MAENKIDIISPFGPSMAKVKMPEKTIKALNDHVNKIINNEERRSISFNAVVDEKTFDVFV